MWESYGYAQSCSLLQASSNEILVIFMYIEACRLLIQEHPWDISLVDRPILHPEKRDKPVVTEIRQHFWRLPWWKKKEKISKRQSIQYLNWRRCLAGLWNWLNLSIAEREIYPSFATISSCGSSIGMWLTHLLLWSELVNYCDVDKK